MKRTISWSGSWLALLLAVAPSDLACSAGDDSTSPQGGNSGGSTTGSGGGSATNGGSGAAGTTTGTGGSGGSDPTTSGGGGTSDASVGTGGTAGAAGSSGTSGAAGRGTGGGTPDGGRGTGGAGGSTADASRAEAGGVAGSTGGVDASSLVPELLRITQGCVRVASAHTYQLDNGQAVNICALTGAYYWTSDMDIDCDGRNVGDGKCPGPDPTYLPDTAFHNSSGQPLAASVTPYVVIPQDFRPAGLAGGNVVAVIYNGRLEFAVFGDTGPVDIIGEASYACAAGLGINPNPANGGVGSGVTYIAFTGTGARPADIENQTQTSTLGQQLVQTLIQNNP